MCTNRTSTFSSLSKLAGIAFLFSSITVCAQPGPIQFVLDPQLVEPEMLVDGFVDGPKIEVVFALDVTGSMNGLLAAAKDKIWSIATSLAQAENNPEISMGIVAYRDRGDTFVTKIIDLNSDLDLVYGQLMALTAGGGGDTPESVNQALFDAVNRISWDTNQNTMRTIFLVGDCPPHMDYSDDVKYPESCKKAIEKDIMINTILMGSGGGTIPTWQSIASIGGGDFIQADMDAGNLAVTTPFDEKIKEANKAIESTKVHWGAENERTAKDEAVEHTIETADDMDADVAARRATYLNTTSSGSATFYNEGELINDIATGSISLDAIAVEELPEELQVMDEEERQVYVDTLVETRTKQQTELNTLIEQRNNYIETEVVEISGSNFTNNIFNSLKRQAKSKKIKMAAAPAY